MTSSPSVSLPPAHAGSAHVPFVLATKQGKVAVALVVLIASAIGFLPQFAGPGYESALLLGILLPGVVIVTMALHIAETIDEPFDALCRGVAAGILLFAVALAITLLHGLRVGLCDAVGGLMNLLLGPGAGMALAGATAVLVAEVARRIKSRGVRTFAIVVMGVGAPLGCIVVSVLRFYTSPMIFAYDPFVGFFSGTLYDTVISLRGLASYRLGTALTLMAAFFLTLHMTRTAAGGIAFTTIGRPGLAVLGVVAGLGSLLFCIEGSYFDHFHTRTTIANALGGAVTSARCAVLYDRRIAADDAARLGKECDAHVLANERWLGVSGSPQLTVYLFRDEAQKQRFMGAAGTNIAKPWRNEVYIQAESYPHRVLGHEVMHVVAGSVGSGPFRIAASAGGIWPNPGLIEGIAVASNPKEDELSPSDWAKALKDLQLLPPLSRLFAMGFLGQHSSTAYTASGAFVGYVHSRFGAEAVRRWYQGAPIEKATGHSLAQLEADWHRELDGRQIPESAMIRAKARFDKPSIFARRCPRLVDACVQRSEKLARDGDSSGALSELERALSFEPDNPSLIVKRALAEREVSAERGLARLQSIASEQKHATSTRDAAKEALADAALQRNDLLQASDLFQEVLSRTHDEAKARTMEVKLRAVQEDAPRAALVALLIGEAGERPDRARANFLLGQLEETAPQDGLASYLQGRYLLEIDAYAEAKRALDRALSRNLKPPRVVAEARRLRIVVACALNDELDARAQLAAYRTLGSTSPARVAWLTGLIDRTFVTRAPERSP